MFGRVQSAQKEVRKYIKQCIKEGRKEDAILNIAVLKSEEFQKATEEERWDILTKQNEFERVAKTQMLEEAAEGGFLREALEALGEAGNK